MALFFSSGIAIENREDQTHRTTMCYTNAHAHPCTPTQKRPHTQHPSGTQITNAREDPIHSALLLFVQTRNSFFPTWVSVRFRAKTG